MKKAITRTFDLLLMISFIGAFLLPLFILGGEPSDWSDDGLAEFEASQDFWVPVFFWAWIGCLSFLGLLWVWAHREKVKGWWKWVVTP